MKIHHIVADNETTPEDLQALRETFMSARIDPVEAVVATRPGVTVTSFEVNPEDKMYATTSNSPSLRTWAAAAGMDLDQLLRDIETDTELQKELAKYRENLSAEGIEPPAHFSRWRHHNGNEYEVTMITNLDTKDASKYPTTIVYVNVLNGKAYSRPLSRWYASMTQITG